MDSAEAKKASVLVLQTLTNLCYGLLMAATRKPSAGKEIFYGPSAVLCFEFIKFVASIGGVFFENYRLVASGADLSGSVELPLTPPPRYTRLAEDDDEKGGQPSNSSGSQAFKIDDEEDNDGTDSVKSPRRAAHGLERRASGPQDYDAADETLVEGTPAPSSSSSDDGKTAGSLENASRETKGTYSEDPVLQEFSTPLPKRARVMKLVKAELFDMSAFRLSVPAILYVIQNNLFFIAAQYLNATEFQIFSQTKLITTAILSVLILGKVLKRQHWLAIMLLVTGIIGTQLSAVPRVAHAAAIESSHPDSHDASHPIANISARALEAAASDPHIRTLIGIAIILLACFFSGLAAVLLEKLYKGKKSFWTLNVHLSCFSLIPAFTPVFANCVSRNAFDPLRSFTSLVWMLVLINAGGGFVVALVMRFADNILKGFALSAALILTMLISAFVTRETYFSVFELIGMLAIVTSMFLYGRA